MDIIKISEDFAKKEYTKHDENHQWNHVEDVMNMALKLAEFHPEVNLEILKLAIIFHVSYEQYETHVEESMKVAEKFLKEHNYPEDKIKKVLQVMLSHSGPHRKKLGEAKRLKEKSFIILINFVLQKQKEDLKNILIDFIWMKLVIC